MVARAANVRAYLLDTSACVQILRNRASVGELPETTETAIPAIVAAELWAGAQNGASLGQTARLEEFLEIFPVVEFTHAAARVYGEIRAELERKGMTIGPMDLLIAAQALSLGATLVTGNLREFRRVKGMKIHAWK